MDKIHPGFKMKSLAQLLFCLLIFSTLYIILFFNSIDLTWFQDNLHILRSYADNNLFLTILIFFIIRFFFAVVSIPGSGVLTIVAGAIFGFLLASILVTISVSLGVFVVFLISRYALRDYLTRKFSDKLEYVEQVSRDHGASLLFLSRVTEIIPSFAINSLFALTPIKASTYYWISLVGLLPGILIYVNAGHQITEIQKLSDLISPKITISLAALGFIPLITSVFYKYICRRLLRGSDYDQLSKQTK
ncbi:TVP38/TMEM64 family protein [Natranaerobius thermophilus]|uniref:TVP38/TMEM64 family membrane protein n=1 Tax=Natranaerobius thermophilus (strain ATCC BAA-1301 / DSM 18059 / JW/NM-WN-LF) TaxID=457570 RepID=B2A0F3_NATTJ|nr:VTT domain-containing protein [Natranaerobius thermophilus]ACB84514.1 SNARE associated Golgi protein [Natranaerobius thermophilus JW/NM-WN-LF]